MSQFKHGVLDDDGCCVMSGLEPAMCAGCRGHEKPTRLGTVGPGRPREGGPAPTWDEFLDAEATREDLEPIDGLDRLDRQPDMPSGYRTHEERVDALARIEFEGGPLVFDQLRRVP